MIAKLETGNGFGGALRYDVRAGKKDSEKELARVLEACGVSYDFDDDGDYVINPKQVGFDFRQQTIGYTGKVAIRKPVYHWALAYSPKDNVSEEQMVRDGRDFLKRIGFDDTQYVMTAHYDKAHHHLHIVTNVVNNQGARIPTMGLIDRAHAAAAAITKERGYTWGEKTKRENIIEDKMHKPHDRAREYIEPIIRDALAKSTSFVDFQLTLIDEYGIMCNFKVAKDGKRGRLSFCCEYEGQQHSFCGSSVARNLSFGYVNAVLKANMKKCEEVKAGYLSIVPPIEKELYALRDRCYELYREVADAGIAVGAETTAKYGELESLWTKYRELNEAINSRQSMDELIGAMGGMLMLLNPLVGQMVIFLAAIASDVRMSSLTDQKKQIISRIESVRDDINVLKEKKAQLKMEKGECIRDYLDAKQCYQEYKTNLKKLDVTIYEDKTIDTLKQEFPFKDNGHIQYIIHGRHDASIFRAEDGEGVYRRMPSGEFYGPEKKERMIDYYEKARLALKERGMCVAGDRGPTAFYEALLEEQKNGVLRVGDMQIHSDGKITFGQERIFSETQKTEHHVLKAEETIKRIALINEIPTPVAASVPVPAPAPQPKPSFEIVRTFTCDYYNFRIKKEADGICKLQQLKPDPNSPVIDHKYSKQAWFNNANFTSFQEVAKDNNGIYFKIKDLEGKTRYINQYGTDLSNKVKARLGLGNGKGTGGVSM